MPIYEYKCEDCGHEFEEMLHFSERDNPIDAPCPNTIRPLCGGKVHLKMSLGSFHLKGSGWYKDGYGKKSTSKEEVAKVKPESSGGITKGVSLIDD